MQPFLWTSSPTRPHAAALRVAIGLGLLATALVPTDAAAITVPGEILVQVGSPPPGLAENAANVRAPFVTGNMIGFIGALEDDDVYVYADGSIIWQNSMSADPVLGAGGLSIERASGVAPGGAFVYSPLADGNDAIWTHNGLILAAGAAAPGVTTAGNLTFNSNPRITDGGAIYWISGVDTNGTPASSEYRVLYRSATAMPGDIEIVYEGGVTMIDGTTIATGTSNGMDSIYAVSEDGAHLLAHLILQTGSDQSDEHIVLDGAIVIQENQAAVPAGNGNWDNFDLVAVNDAGNWLLTGDTTAADATDEFVAYNGSIAVREGDTLDDVNLPAASTLRFVGLNDWNQATHAWNLGGGNSAVFFACDAGDLAGTSQLVLANADELDLDGDGTGDATVENITALSNQENKPLSEDYNVYMIASVDTGAGPADAMIRLPVTCCGNGALDPLEECDDGNADDTDVCPSTCTNAVCGDGFVLDGVEACDDGNDDDTDACLSTCVEATCGDGFVQAGVEDCDDANDDDTDECLSTCVAASCGDGVVQDGVEECDDGNDDDTDECPSTCAPATCGDGFVQAGVEDCDDGNDDDTDECANDCTVNAMPGTTGDTGGTDDTSGADDSTGGGSMSAGSMTTAGSAGSDDSGSDTDTDGGGGASSEDGCSCTTGGDDRPLPAVAWSIFALGMLGLRSRRPRR